MVDKPAAPLPIQAPKRAGADPIRRILLRAGRKSISHTLVQFTMMGALIFCIYDPAGRHATDIRSTVIGVDARQIKWLAETWNAQFGRQPNAAELRSAVAGYVQEEMRYREAVGLGLGDDDSVVRRRLAQKYSFVFESPSEPLPSEAELAAYYKSHLNRYRTQDLFSFCQSFFSVGTGVEKVSNLLLTASASKLQDPQAFNAPPSALPIQRCYDRAGLDQIRRDFGGGFARSLTNLPSGAWAGPVQSGYGLHLVLLRTHVPGKVLPFAAARPSVGADWRAAELAVERARAAAAIATKYTVRIDDRALVRIAAGAR